ncbi:MAG: TetR/AcrR family transcriptional regulator [Cellulomonas sp.]
MSRMPVAERREQLIEAALSVACRDGIDAATVRAVAAEAGVSLGVVHYCFLDKDELLRAVAAAITERNVAGIGHTTGATDLRSLLESAVMSYWDTIVANRGAQLLSYELTTASLRHPELGRVAMDQFEGAWSVIELFLQGVEQGAGIRWTVPHRQLARTIIAIADGFTLAWLVDGDLEAGRIGMLNFARFLETQAVPAGDGDNFHAESPMTVQHLPERATLRA